MKNIDSLSPIQSLIKKLELLTDLLDQKNIKNKSVYKYNSEKKRHELDTGFTKTGFGITGAIAAVNSCEANINGSYRFGLKRKRS